MNLGFVVGRDAVAVIDTGYTEEMAGGDGGRDPACHRLADPVPINTNSQPHRFMGNEVFRKQGARVIASVEAADRMEKEGGISCAVSPPRWSAT